MKEKMYLPEGDKTDKNSKLHISESMKLKGKHNFKITNLCPQGFYALTG